MGLETADFLLKEGKEITILEMLKHVGQDMSPWARKMVLERLIQNCVEIITEAKTVSVDENGVVFDRAGVLERVNGVDSIIVAVGTASQEAGIRSLASTKFPIRLVGDCSVPRKIFDAIHEGFLVGREL